MSCCCNSSPCVCAPCCPESCPEIVEYDASNINLAGVGVFDAEVANEFQFRGIRSTNVTLTVALNAALHTVDLTIAPTSFLSTAIFANAATRANTVPAFIGQVGVQIDTGVTYTATGLLAGNWASQIFTFNNTNTPTNGAITTINHTNHGFTFNGGTTGSISLVNTNFFFNAATLTYATSDVTFDACTVNFTNGTIIDFIATTRIEIASVLIPANSLVRTSGTIGQLSSDLIAAYLSTNNIQAGWGAPTGVLTRTTFDTTTVTLPQLAERVAALISDLRAVRLPQA